MGAGGKSCRCRGRSRLPPESIPAMTPRTTDGAFSAIRRVEPGADSLRLADALMALSAGERAEGGCRLLGNG